METLPSERYLKMRFILSSEGNSTRLVDTWSVKVAWYEILVARLIKNKIKNAVADNLDKLKTLLETGKVTLQDGRDVSLRNRY